MCVLSRLGCVRLFVTPRTIARQAPLSMGFSRQEYWSGLPFPPPGESFQPRDQTLNSYASCIGRWVLYHSRHLGSHLTYRTNVIIEKMDACHFDYNHQPLYLPCVIIWRGSLSSPQPQWERSTHTSRNTGG